MDPNQKRRNAELEVLQLEAKAHAWTTTGQYKEGGDYARYLHAIYVAPLQHRINTLRQRYWLAGYKQP